MLSMRRSTSSSVGTVFGSGFMEISIYVDESSQECHEFMVISALILETASEPVHTAAFSKLREANRLHPTQGELKWGKASRARLDAYFAIVDGFFGRNKKDELHWHSLIIDNKKLNHKKFNHGDSDVGFSKFLYQLLVSIGRKYEQRSPGQMKYYVYLDQRTSKQSIETLKDIINAGLRRHWSINYSPFRRIVYIDSKKSLMMQVNEILLGATAFHKNGRHLTRDALHPKCQIAQRICRHLGCPKLGVSTPKGVLRFSNWNFVPN